MNHAGTLLVGVRTARSAALLPGKYLMEFGVPETVDESLERLFRLAGARQCGVQRARNGPRGTRLLFVLILELVG